ncbi:cell wall-binding repeat-containing protein, partial [Stomatohabitans albus]|uniref:cell wall-binding repeat-containing protein n=1 Tax=Stomatohabitans albus TaxID=3110766 RepID=UPI00300C3602
PVVPGPVAPTPAPTTSPNATEPTPAPTASPTPDATNPVRLAGSNRIETAIAVNRDLVKATPKRVFIASADNPADAVAAAPLAAAEHAPIYVTWKDDIDPKLANELATVIRPDTHVTVLGGEAAISAKVAKALGGVATRQDRLAGANRADTATKVADQLVSEHKHDRVMIADGQRWEAPIVAAPPAIATKQAILLSNGDQAAPETKAWLAAHKVELTTTIGNASKAHPNVGRAIGETDGPALSLAVANAFYPKPTRIGFATGRTPVDAMVAGTYLSDGPILLVERELSQSQRDWVNASPAATHIIFGGREAIESL